MNIVYKELMSLTKSVIVGFFVYFSTFNFITSAFVTVSYYLILLLLSVFLRRR